jgi:large conductance mechanosensitive channel
MKKFFSEFKEFAIKGNALDLAIGVIIGAAFKAIVDSIVNDIIMPFMGILLGGKDFSGMAFKIGEAEIKYGSLIQTAVNFLIVAFCLFLLVKFVNKLKDGFAKKEEDVAEEPAEPVKSEEVILLEQIRDALQNK